MLKEEPRQNLQQVALGSRGRQNAARQFEKMSENRGAVKRGNQVNSLGPRGTSKLTKLSALNGALVADDFNHLDRDFENPFNSCSENSDKARDGVIPRFPSLPLVL
jgi:hypothetical protein